MRRATLTTLVLILAASAAVAFAQVGAKDFVRRSLDNSIQEHNQAIGEAMNDDNPQPQQSNPDAGNANAPAKAGWITRKSKDGKSDVRLYFAQPAGMSKTHPAAGLIVVQEWWGVNEDMQERTREFASRGFYAVAPDLYYGKTTDDPAKAAELKNAMTDPAAMTAMKTGLDLLSEEGQNGVVDMKRTGVIGFCMGGTQALNLAMHDGRVHATAIFYGPLETDWLKLKPIDGPVLGVFGNDDKAPSPADVNKFVSALNQAGKRGDNVTIYRFDGVGHAFASKSATKMGAYNADKAKDAWAKTFAWLDAKLLKK